MIGTIRTVNNKLFYTTSMARQLLLQLHIQFPFSKLKGVLIWRVFFIILFINKKKFPNAIYLGGAKEWVGTLYMVFSVCDKRYGVCSCFGTNEKENRTMLIYASPDWLWNTEWLTECPWGTRLSDSCAIVVGVRTPLRYLWNTNTVGYLPHLTVTLGTF